MPTIQEVKAYLAQKGVQVWEFDQWTPTSELAARAVGCSVGEIAKSILFLVGDRPVVVVTCGDRKVKGSLLKKAVGLTGKVRLPKEDEVIRHTGYAPGGVCPFLLPDRVTVVIDSSMRRFPRVYAAAGNDRSAVPITVDRLLEITGGLEASVCPPPNDGSQGTV
ncbi:Cys-tRNA(Pro) deacylase, prolyl-tRNA editing enzyme YbaK/EbsC [Desulfacinum hydrothermale DSM 13146]|uniref:Cys-tRNA(Pro) deacylase, prolyl-tRNA editing enzyme YbaK/EbsC n=1 Tax=Desulfacinum hydrothermale DSM 13146 TaxID=1121390 RepID=A0A1W1XTF6_9BACT|nr:YbaK/EbsC family protein [Desulfacinum hydrothermale]SMC26808.1 Cys-tRNA(Pro) deacylase, prolyl-tRNA editing enzyme YbaK/EbsC [Desulfacinum hydrothermale DSM 13146]